MKMLSDEQGMQIRGEGKAKVWAWNISLIKANNVGKNQKITVIQSIRVINR
jgi:hypothetical protein